VNIDEIKAYMKSHKITYDDLAEKTQLSVSTIKKIFSGVSKYPRVDTMEAIEKALNLKSDNIHKPANIYPVNGLVVFEEIGTVRAGYNGTINEIPTGRKIELPSSMLGGGDKDEYFVLRVSGTSMYPRLLEGDTILCKRCTTVDSGELAVILYNGDEATVKKVKYVQGEDWLELIPFNPEYPVKRIEGSDLEQCRVLGKVMKLIRDV
jgi:repressor LexA